MKTKRRTWLTLIGLLSGLALAASVAAQTPASDKRSDPIQAEDADSGATNALGTTSSSNTGVDRQTMVSFGKDLELKAGDSAEVVVVIGGSARIHGRVRQAVVAIGGDVEVDSQVDESVVAVLGSIKVKRGAKIHGDAVAVGGGLEIATGAEVDGEKVDMSTKGLPSLIWLRDWFLHCVLWLRPLAPQVGWVWLVAGLVSLFYLLVAAVFPHPVQVCVQEITRRPATTFLLGLLTKLLAPVVCGLLFATGIGILVLPFLWAALLAGAIIGKIALIEWIGLRIGRQFQGAPLQHPLVGFLLGLIVILVLYNIPFLGLLTLIIVSIWGLGCAVTAAFGGLRRELPERPPSPPSPPAGYGPQAAAAAYAAGIGNPGLASDIPPSTPSAESANYAAGAQPGLQAAVPEALACPRAGFWERMGAGFLDMVLVGILSGMVDGSPWGFVVALAYFAGMWAWKGTTVGGVVLGLKVVRLDYQPVTFTVALVRGLAAAFSIVVLFLGFLWIIWDKERQGWHDRIAGTVVVRQPRRASLVCI